MHFWFDDMCYFNPNAMWKPWIEMMTIRMGWYVYLHIVVTCIWTKLMWKTRIEIEKCSRRVFLNYLHIPFTKCYSTIFHHEWSNYKALQIKYGLPQKTALYEQFLTRKVSHMNYIGFRIYRSLPFLFEIRCILDWSCSTTSLTMYDWLKVCYIIRCFFRFFVFEYSCKIRMLK